MLPTQISTVRKPSRRSSAGAVTRIINEPMELAKVISPLCAADMPKPSCSIIGSRNGCAPALMRDSEPQITDRRNVAMRMIRKSRIGCAQCRACQA